MNKKIYISTIIISLLLMIPALIWPLDQLTIIAGVGCSGVAAALMAIFMDKKAEENRQQKRISGRARYLTELYCSTYRLIGQFLWMSKHLEDDWFGWELFSGKSFFTFAHHMFISEEKRNMVENESVTSDEAKKLLQEFSHQKFEWGQYDTLDTKTKTRISKMYLAVFEANQDIISEMILLNNNKLYLDTEGYLTLEETDSLCRELSGIMSALNPNLQYPIETCPGSLSMIIETLYKYTGKEKNVIIGRHETFFN